MNKLKQKGNFVFTFYLLFNDVLSCTILSEKCQYATVIGQKKLLQFVISRVVKIWKSSIEMNQTLHTGKWIPNRFIDSCITYRLYTLESFEWEEVIICDKYGKFWKQVVVAYTVELF